MEEKKEKKYIKTKDCKDVLFGVFLIIFGFVFFIVATFTIIISKIVEIKEEDFNQLPTVIQFLINDKHYVFCVVLFMPTIIILFALRRIAFLYFRHIY